MEANRCPGLILPNLRLKICVNPSNPCHPCSTFAAMIEYQVKNKETGPTVFNMTLYSLRIVFMGTPEFAVASLDALVKAGYNIVGVITAPDKPGEYPYVCTYPGHYLVMRGVLKVVAP